MLNEDLLFKYNTPPKKGFNKKTIRFNGREACYTDKTKIFTGDNLYKIIHVLNYLITTYPNNRVPVKLNFGKFCFHDKLVYILLECVSYYMLTNRKQNININFEAEYTIWSEGIRFSPLCLLNGENENIPLFIKKFNFDLNQFHYRKLIKSGSSDEYLSILMSDIYCFLKNNKIETNSCKDIAEVVVELVGNATEHTNSDCLIDLDITAEYINSDNNVCCYGLNVCVLNFSDKLFYELLKEKVYSDQVLPERYELIKKAKKNHEQLYTSQYTENDFFTIASFQHKISGSKRKVYTGGTGLTSLIKSLEERSEGHWCYMLTGKRVMFLKPEHMKYDNEKLIGFNDKHDFINSIPDADVFLSINTNLPGTAYNLNFALRKEED